MLEIFNAKRIPTHGGSIRVYAARKGEYPIDASVQELLKAQVYSKWAREREEREAQKEQREQKKTLAGF